MTTPTVDGQRQADARLLVVEDEPNILELLSASLRYAGFEVVTAAAGGEAVQAAQRHRPDLIVLDVMLPDMDGFDVIRRLRGGGARIPVGFLTAKDATEDKIRGLTLGGDDYVTKPFSLEEGIARIRAVLRRTRGGGVEPTPRLTFADLELDEESHEVWRAGEQIQLSPTEFKLLRYFMSNSNRVLSKMQILDHVWDYDFRGDTGIVESYVSVLRRKVDTKEPRLIHTLRGVGYVLRLPSSESCVRRWNLREQATGSATGRPGRGTRYAGYRTVPRCGPSSWSRSWSWYLQRWRRWASPASRCCAGSYSAPTRPACSRSRARCSHACSTSAARAALPSITRIPAAPSRSSRMARTLTRRTGRRSPICPAAPPRGWRTTHSSRPPLPPRRAAGRGSRGGSPLTGGTLFSR